MDISIEIVYGYTMDLVGNCKFQSMDFTYFSQCLLLYVRELYIKRLDLQSCEICILAVFSAGNTFLA
jgi:hypothetical protein